MIRVKIFCLASFLVCAFFQVRPNGSTVSVQKDMDGYKLIVDGKDFIIKGMNWDYYPIGTNYTYSLWDQSDTTIKEVLDQEMTLLKNMGVNTLRIYVGIPKKWIAYIHKNYGIYTMLNHPFGRYGLTINGEWMANTAYDHPQVRELLLREVSFLAEEYKDTPGLLFYLLGNENNYGLYWKENETNHGQEEKTSPTLNNRGMYKLFLLGKGNKNFAGGAKAQETLDFDQKVAQRAKAMYALFDEAALAMKSIDTRHPIALCNGDIMFIETIQEICRNIDIFGTNMYRGISFGDSFQRVAEELEKPLLFTEFGADAFNAITNKEDQESQVYYLLRNWKEIYANAAGMGGAKNCIGGFTFQFSDSWWKVSQYENLDVHDQKATWNNGGYHKDANYGANNMNEEWFGVCSKVPANSNGSYTLLPRAAYFVLAEVHKFSPYDSFSTLALLEDYFKNLQLDEAIKKSKAYGRSLENDD